MSQEDETTASTASIINPLVDLLGIELRLLTLPLDIYIRHPGMAKDKTHSIPESISHYVTYNRGNNEWEVWTRDNVKICVCEDRDEAIAEYRRLTDAKV